MNLLPCLPDDLSLLCLVRLPLKSLLRLRCVNRYWMEALSNNHFLIMRRTMNYCEDVLITIDHDDVSLAWNKDCFLFDSNGTIIKLDDPSTFIRYHSNLWTLKLLSKLFRKDESLSCLLPFECIHPESSKPPNVFISTRQIWSLSFFYSQLSSLFFICNSYQMLTVFLRKCEKQYFLEMHEWDFITPKVQPLPYTQHEEGYKVNGCILLHRKVYIFRSEVIRPQLGTERIDVYDLITKQWMLISNVKSPFLQYYRGMVTFVNETIFGIFSTSCNPVLGRTSICKLDMENRKWNEVLELPQIQCENVEGVPFVENCNLVSFSNRLFVFCKGGFYRRHGFCSNISTGRNWMNVLDVGCNGELSWKMINVLMEKPVHSVLSLSL